MKTPDTILILDFGSQVTQLIARRIRSAGVRAEIVPFSAPLAALRDPAVKGIILSGGPSSVYERGAPRPPKELFALGKPILGICYGCQAIAYAHRARVERGTLREYGETPMVLRKGSEALFRGTPRRQIVWMSHGDAVRTLPRGFRTIASSSNSPYAAIADARRRIYGATFHPEVWHTRHGAKILENFAKRIARAKAEWSAKDVVGRLVREIRAAVGRRRVVHAVSGGVDSTVLAVLLKKALPARQVKNVFIDTGLLRLNEAGEVRAALRRLGLKVHHHDASAKFLRALRGIEDPEQKRRIIGKLFVHVLMGDVANTDMLSQGTLYPDVIESVSVKGPSHKIKTHHNRAPEVLALMKQGRVLEPLKDLFKDEVRAAGKTLRVPDAVLYRHPFPGPGLGIRVIGVITAEKLRILREADAIFIEEIRRAGLYREVSQAFAAIDEGKAVGVKGDGREYGAMILLRAVSTQDFMTADWYRFPPEFLTRVASRIVNEVRGVTRVLYDVTQKPPATICYM